MDVLKVFDAYSLRARLFPAVIAAAPAIAALALLISWKSFELSNILATLATVVLLFAIADLARTRGRRIETGLYAENGGMPSIVMFRRNDSTLADTVKERYRGFLAQQIGVKAPSATVEEKDVAASDSFYEHCGVWLRQHTRDTKKFPILFNENVTYGFRRNLLGVKWFGLGLNLVVVVLCGVVIWRGSYSMDTPLAKRVLVVLIVAVAHAIYMLVAVNKKAVWDASRAYGREMILSCEAFLTIPQAPRKKASAKSAADT